MRWAITYLALLVIAAGLVWFHLASREREDERTRLERVEKRLFALGEETDTDVLRENVAEVFVDRAPDGESIVVRHLESGDDEPEWRIVEPRDLPADDTAVNSLVRTLITLELAGAPEDSVIPDVTSAELRHFGLDAPAFRAGLRYSDEESSRMLAVGAKDPTDRNRYAMLDDSEDILVVRDRQTSLDRTLFDLRDKTVLHFENDEAVSLTVVDASREVLKRVARDGTGDTAWRLEWPVEDEAEISEVRRILNQLRNARVQSFLIEDADEGDLATFGLATPEWTVTLVVGEGGAQRTHRLLIGEEQAGNRRVKRETGSQIFTIRNTVIDTLTEPASKLRSRDITKIESADLRAVVCEVGGAHVGFEPVSPEEEDAGPRWTTVDPPEAWDEDAAAEALDNMVSGLRSLRANSILTDEEADNLTAWGLASPEATLLFQFKDEQAEDLILDIGASRRRDGVDGRAVRRSGRDAVFFVAKVNADALMLDLDALIAKPEPEATGPAPSPEVAGAI